MSTRLKHSSGNGKKVSDPFRPTILQKAREIVRHYKLIIEKSDHLGYLGSSVEMPTVLADGATPDQCYRATQEALSVAVATMLEAGQTPPQSAGFMKRTTQVNVRLTPEEKALMASAAAKAGFKGLGDFIRATVLDRALFNR